MRTTLTLDDDVALALRRIQQRFPDKSFKQIVNQVMKSGLAANGELIRVPFKVKASNTAKPKPGLNFDCISELISQAEGDFHK